MNKEELTKKLEETKVKLKSICKDAHFADALIREMLDVHSQVMNDNVFPNLCYSNIEDAYDGGSFDMETFKDGTIMYHAKGGYTIIADYRMTSLNKTIRDFIDKLSGNIDISEDMTELIELDLASNLQVLNIPMYAFSDVNLKFELATKVIEYINGLYQIAIESKPEDEDVEANKIFHDAVIGSSNANEVKDYVKSKD